MELPKEVSSDRFDCRVAVINRLVGLEAVGAHYFAVSCGVGGMFFTQVLVDAVVLSLHHPCQDAMFVQHPACMYLVLFVSILLYTHMHTLY